MSDELNYIKAWYVDQYQHLSAKYWAHKLLFFPLC